MLPPKSYRKSEVIRHAYSLLFTAVAPHNGSLLNYAFVKQKTRFVRYKKQVRKSRELRLLYALQKLLVI
jgi:hypothetical protein